MPRQVPVKGNYPYAEISTPVPSSSSTPSSNSSSNAVSKFLRNPTKLFCVGAVLCVLLVLIYVHNLVFYKGLHDGVETVETLEHYILETQKHIRTDVFGLLHNIR